MIDAASTADRVEDFRRRLGSVVSDLKLQLASSASGSFSEALGEGMAPNVNRMLRGGGDIGDYVWAPLSRLIHERLGEPRGIQFEAMYRQYREDLSHLRADGLYFGSRHIDSKKASQILARTDFALGTDRKALGDRAGLIDYVGQTVDAERRAGRYGHSVDIARSISSYLFKNHQCLHIDLRTASSFAAYALFAGVWAAKVSPDKRSLRAMLNDVRLLKSKSDDPYITVVEMLTKFYLAHANGQLDPSFSIADLDLLWEAWAYKTKSLMCKAGQSEAGLLHNMAGYCDHTGIEKYAQQTLADMYAKSVVLEADTERARECHVHRTVAVGNWHIKNGRYEQAIDLGQRCLVGQAENMHLQHAHALQMIGVAKKNYGCADWEKTMNEACLLYKDLGRIEKTLEVGRYIINNSAR